MEGMKPGVLSVTPFEGVKWQEPQVGLVEPGALKDEALLAWICWGSDMNHKT